MLDQSRFSQIDQKRAHLFIERYQDLFAWALRLTNQNRASAEDLVQDAFVQFVMARPSLQQIQNIDGYLRRILLYMHFSRINGVERRLNDATLSIADYDSVHFGWPAIEPSRRMQVVEELHQICAYVCWRKESSRAGSVLILRFFHDYLPSEIAAVLNTTRHCVDQWQRLARQEARHRRSENDKPQANTWRLSSLPSGCDLKVELRKMIFNSRRGECLSRRNLEEIYLERHKGALTAKKLAHIVSCHACLDAVNSLLGLTLLERRHQIESPSL
ncbi:MAG TPA: sigma factor [Pyrinomonadaceae bacterium]|nr:sigma factor [Pyrinomonadaceae bacterium]